MMSESLWWLITTLIVSLLGMLGVLVRGYIIHLNKTLENFGDRLIAQEDKFIKILNDWKRECHIIHAKIQEQFINILTIKNKKDG
jgi:hypothetical protein